MRDWLKVKIVKIDVPNPKPGMYESWLQLCLPLLFCLFIWAIIGGLAWVVVTLLDLI